MKPESYKEAMKLGIQETRAESVPAFLTSCVPYCLFGTLKTENFNLKTLP